MCSMYRKIALCDINILDSYTFYIYTMCGFICIQICISKVCILYAYSKNRLHHGVAITFIIKVLLSKCWCFTFLLRNMYRCECSPERRRYWVDWLSRCSQLICVFLSCKILELTWNPIYLRIIDAKCLNVISKFYLDIFNLDNYKGEINTPMEKETAAMHNESKHTCGHRQTYIHLSLGLS